MVYRPPAPVVQWIEYWFPVPTIGVRIPSGAQHRSAFTEKVSADRGGETERERSFLRFFVLDEHLIFPLFGGNSIF